MAVQSSVNPSGLFVAEATFYGTTPGNMTLVSSTMTTDATVSNGRLLLEYDDACSGMCDSITLETDMNARVTCDGTNWVDTVLSSAGTAQGGHKVAETSDTSCGANTGTDFAFEITTSNNKNVRIYGVAAVAH